MAPCAGITPRERKASRTNPEPEEMARCINLPLREMNQWTCNRDYGHCLDACRPAGKALDLKSHVFILVTKRKTVGPMLTMHIPFLNIVARAANGICCDSI